MEKKDKRLLFTLILIIIVYVCYNFGSVIINQHSADWKTYKQYMWMFTDSAKCDIDTNFCVSYVKENDVYNEFNYKGTYNIVIWEFKDLKKMPLDGVEFNNNIDLDDVKFGSHEILNSKSDVSTTIKSGFNFKGGGVNLNFDSHSKIRNKLATSNYKGVYGNFTKFSLSDDFQDHQIMVEYKNVLKYTMVLVCKTNGKFIVIIIDSDNPFDQNIIKIFNNVLCCRSSA